MFKKILIIFLTFSLIACQSDSKEEEKPAELNEIDSKFSFEKIWTKNLFSDFPLGEVNLVFNQESIFAFNEAGIVSSLDFLEMKSGKKILTKKFQLV